MNFLKKILPLFAVTVLALCLTLSLAACGEEETPSTDNPPEAPACTHVFGEFSMTSTPTCTVDGLKKATCSKCGTEKTAPVKALGHRYANDGVCVVCGEGETGSQPAEPSEKYFTVTVKDKGGAPISGATVSIFVDWTPSTYTTDESGQVSLPENTAVNMVTLDKLPAEYSSFTTEATVIPTEEKSVAFNTDAEKLVKFTVTLKYEDGSAVAGVNAQICFSEVCKPGQTDDNGKMSAYFTKSEAESGEVKVKVIDTYEYECGADGYVYFGDATELVIILKNK